MDPSRRTLLKTTAAAASLAQAFIAPSVIAQSSSASPPASAPATASTPTKDDFPGIKGTYLNSASVHPLTRAAAQAMAQYAEAKIAGNVPMNSAAIQAKFARLINAAPAEICYAPSTSMAEYLVTSALGMPASKGRIVTDALHFVGSLHLYQQLEQRGMEVVVVRMREDGSIDPRQLDEAITRDTRLVAVSHVSFVNGFEHDMKALCDLAHSRGALVFADIIQSAGAMPVDVKAWDVDFAAAGTYKWLMGDFGLAFLYAKSAIQSRLQRPWFGYLQTSNFFNPPTRLFPHDATGEPAIQFNQRTDLGGLFNGSFVARPVEAAINASLDWLMARDVARIAAQRQPLIDAIRAGMVRQGYVPMTSAGSRSPIISFAYKDAAKLAPKLNAAGVAITLTANRIRISPSAFNDMGDVEKLLAAIELA